MMASIQELFIRTTILMQSDIGDVMDIFRRRPNFDIFLESERLEARLGRVFAVFLGILGFIALLFFFYGLFKFVAGANSPMRREDGKSIMKYAAIGVLIVATLATILIPLATSLIRVVA